MAVVGFVDARQALPNLAPRQAVIAGLIQLSTALTSALARAGSMLVAWRAFTSPMTRPMSFIERGAGLGDDRGDRGLGLVLAHLRGQEAFDDRDFGFFHRGQLLAVALAVHLDRFAALLDHFLQHFGDQQIVVGLAPRRCAARCRGS